MRAPRTAASAGGSCARQNIHGTDRLMRKLTSLGRALVVAFIETILHRAGDFNRVILTNAAALLGSIRTRASNGINAHFRLRAMSAVGGRVPPVRASKKPQSSAHLCPIRGATFTLAYSDTAR